MKNLVTVSTTAFGILAITCGGGAVKDIGNGSGEPLSYQNGNVTVVDSTNDIPASVKDRIFDIVSTNFEGKQNGVTVFLVNDVVEAVESRFPEIKSLNDWRKATVLNGDHMKGYTLTFGGRCLNFITTNLDTLTFNTSQPAEEIMYGIAEHEVEHCNVDDPGEKEVFERLRQKHPDRN